MAVNNFKPFFLMYYFYYSFKNRISPLKFASVNMDLKSIKKGYYSKHKLNKNIAKKNLLKSYLINKNLSILENIKKIESNFKYPLILKPDWGESSIGVKKVENRYRLNLLLKIISKTNIKFLVQKFSNLKYEIDILYVNDNSKKLIIDITQVKNPFIIGNGRDNLKILIENNFKKYKNELLNLNKIFLNKIIKKNKIVYLTKINSMNYGSKFINIIDKFSNKEKEIILKNISKFENFKFAKITIKTNNYKDLILGNFKVIETNILFPLKSSLISNKIKKETKIEIKDYIKKLIPIVKHSKNNISFFNLCKFYIKNYIHKQKIKNLFL